MREELIRAKSEASAVQFELDEAREDVLRDKEELQDVQRRAQKIADEVGRTKTEVEKVKREAKQVKSLLAIARKLLASAEREKVKAHTEIDEARTEVRMAQKELEDMVRQVTQGQHTSTTEIISSASAVASTLNAGFSSPSRTDTFSPTQVELPVPFSNTPPMRSDSINPFGWLQNTSVWAASQASPFTNVSSTIVGTSTGGSAASFEMAASTWKPGNSSKRFSTSTATENNVPTATQFSPPSQQNNSGSAPDW
ncbi:hypothetical protein FRC07_003166 [Ceratobasidium sp. 392]|nr:hypothetical protein FRC07_003166 [Ceratobasidium sp. 392]